MHYSVIRLHINRRYEPISERMLNEWLHLLCFTVVNAVPNAVPNAVNASNSSSQ